MTDLEAARAEIARIEAQLAADPDDAGLAFCLPRAKIAFAVQLRITEDVAEHEARQARFRR